MITYRYPELLFILLMPFVGKHRDMLRYRHLYPYISKKSFIWAGEHVMLEQYDEHRLGNSVAVAARIIYRLSKLVPDKMDRSGLFSFFSKELRASFHYDRFSIFLYDAERDFLTAFTAADGTVVEVFSDTRIAQNTVAWQAIQTRKPVVIKNLASLNWGGAVSLASVGLTATIALPLILNRQVIGTLHVSFVRQPDNLVEILNLLQQLSPVLTTFLFVILTEERRARTQAADRAALDSPCETEAAFPLENSLLETKAMTKVMALARKAAKLHIPVLISGETGTGKSMLARWLHLHSPRRAANFVKVNCPSLAPTLFESEMFGYAKGAFTGAYAKRIGRIEMAQKGTLFLDEIGELSLDMQSKLLQVMEESSFERVGDARSINVDIRVLSATNIDLETSLAQGRLRRDLFYRLASVTLRLPPLRDRQSDIPILVDYYIKQFSKSWLIEPPHLSASVLGALCNHDWPGNIRELRNVVSRLLLHSLDGAVTEALVRETLHEWDNISGQTAKPAQLLSLSAPAEIPLQAPSRGNDTDLPSLEENERAHILEALRLTGGRLSGPRGAAALLKVPRSTLQHRIRKLGIVV